MRNKYVATCTDPDLYETTKWFIAHSYQLRAGWTQHPHMKAYIRLALIGVDGHLGRGGLCKSFQIANITVATRGQGLFTKYLMFAEGEVARSPDVHYLYVESVLNKRLAAFLLRRGYTERKFGIGPSSFYKCFEDESYVASIST